MSPSGHRSPLNQVRLNQVPLNQVRRLHPVIPRPQADQHDVEYRSPKFDDDHDDGHDDDVDRAAELRLHRHLARAVGHPFADPGRTGSTGANGTGCGSSDWFCYQRSIRFVCGVGGLPSGLADERFLKPVSVLAQKPGDCIDAEFSFKSP